MRYFLTGGTGFVGGEVARQLMEAGHEVVALVRDPERARHLADRGISLASGDVTDRDSMRAPMRGVDGVFHLAGWYRVGARDPRPGWAINVDGTRNVLSLVRELEIPKAIYTSSLAVFSDTGGRLVDERYRHRGPWLSVYDHTKWVAHYEVAEPMMREGLPLVIVQPELVYGPGDTSQMGDAWRQYLRRRLPAIPKGTAFCWGHVEDTARGHLLGMERGRTGESYIIAGPAHSLEEAFTLAERITGIPAPPLRPAPEVLKMGAAAARIVERFIPLPDSYTSEGLRVTAGVTYLGNSEKAQLPPCFSVRPLEEGLRETLPSMANRHQDFLA